MESIEIFKKLRDVCAEIVEAYEQENEELLETAMGKFIVLMIKAQHMK